MSNFGALDLASRPYAALQLLKKTGTVGNRQLMSNIPEASLGPIIVHPLPRDWPELPAALQKFSPALLRKRQEYLGDLVGEMCRRVIKNNTYLRARQTTHLTTWRHSILTGYIRLTTFGQSFLEVYYHLRPTLRGRIEGVYGLPRSVTLDEQRPRGLLAFTLLSLVRTAGLPLSLDHELELRAASQKFLHAEHGSDVIKWATWALGVVEDPPDRKSRKTSPRAAASVAIPFPLALPPGRSSSAASHSILATRGRPKHLRRKRKIQSLQKRIGRDASHIQEKTEEKCKQS